MERSYSPLSTVATFSHIPHKNSHVDNCRQYTSLPATAIRSVLHCRNHNFTTASTFTLGALRCSLLRLTAAADNPAHFIKHTDKLSYKAI